MPEVRFYHLTRTPLEATLPAILETSLSRGWRVLVQCGDQNRMGFLGEKLWTARPDSFLPHGMSTAENAADQPILLTMDTENLNNASVLMLVDGAKSNPKRMAEFDLACLFFDGNDDAAVNAARSDWKAVCDAKIQAVYWAQDGDGRWVKKAESAAVG